jgi:hypothetical protein
LYTICYTIHKRVEEEYSKEELHLTKTRLRSQSSGEVKGESTFKEI